MYFEVVQVVMKLRQNCLSLNQQYSKSCLNKTIRHFVEKDLPTTGFRLLVRLCAEQFKTMARKSTAAKIASRSRPVGID